MPSLVGDLLDRLRADFDFREESGHLRSGRCPLCGRRSLWTRMDRPWLVFCNHQTSCGHTFSARQQYPDLFAAFERYHPSTPDDPQATARAFLSSRGFDPARFEGWWEQGKWTDKSGPFAGQALTTVCFSWSEGGTTWKNHRIVSPPPGCEKTRTWPAYKGRVWAPPDLLLAGDIFVGEGVMEALSWISAGQQAVSPLSCGHLADAWLDMLRGERVSLKIAFNNDPAGRAGADKWAAACDARGIAHELLLPPSGQDWNDLLLAGAMAPGDLEKTLAEARWRGRLHGAKTPTEYFSVWHERSNGALFEYREATYLGEVKEDEKITRRIADCTLRVLSVRRVVLDEDYSDHTDVVDVRHRGRPPKRLLLDGDAWSGVTRFRAALKRGANGVFEGSASDLVLLQRHLFQRPAQDVRFLTVIGYDALTGGYFFPGAAYDRQGRRHEIAAEGSFRFGREHYSLPPMPPDERRRWLTSTSPLDIPAVLRDLRASRPNHDNLCVLGYYVATLFRAQVLEKLGFFPFLFVWGEHNAGKTPLIQLCNRLLGHNDEGMPASPANSRAGEMRLLSSYSNLPVVITEIDEVEGYTANFNLRSLYNGGPLRHIGRRTMDRTTVRDDFLGGLIFTGNSEPWTDVPQRTRFVALRFNRQRETDPVRAAIQRLQTTPPQALAGFLHQVLTRRDALLAALLARQPSYKRALAADAIVNDRVADNYAVVAAGFHAAAEALLPDEHERAEFTEGVYRALLAQAARRLWEVHAAPDDVLHFFDRIGQMIRDGNLANYSRNEAEIAFSMTDAESWFAKEHLPWRVDYTALKRTPHFVASNANKSRLPPHTSSTVRCWVFRREAFD